MKSLSVQDVGVWVVTLSAKLLNYSGVPAVTKAFTLNVLDPKRVNCSNSFLSDITYFIDDATTFIIPACIVTPIMTADTNIG